MTEDDLPEGMLEQLEKVLAEDAGWAPGLVWPLTIDLGKCGGDGMPLLSTKFWGQVKDGRQRYISRIGSAQAEDWLRRINVSPWLEYQLSRCADCGHVRADHEDVAEVKGDLLCVASVQIKGHTTRLYCPCRVFLPAPNGQSANHADRLKEG